jgi:hypothetical protein
MIRLACAAVLSLALATCGSATAPSSQGGLTVTFTSTGVTPREISINRRARITFVNDDTRPHRPASDAHPEHALCPELNLPTLQPDERVQTAELVNARECGFHDELRPTEDRYTGRILVGVQ